MPSTLETNIGKSNLLLAELPSTPPLPPANSFKLYTKDVGGITHLVGVDSAGTITDYHIRQTLSGATSIFVSNTGSNTTGTGSSGAPFQTLQFAYDYAASTYDFAGQTVTIRLAAGHTFAPLTITKVWVGGGQLQIMGDTYPNPTTILDNSGTILDNIAANVPLPGQITISKVKIRNSGGFNGVNLAAAGFIAVTNIQWDTFSTNSNHLNANGTGAKLQEFGLNTISADFGAHYLAQFQSYVLGNSGTVTLTGGTRTANNGWVNGRDSAIIQVANTFSGTGAGFRYILRSYSQLDIGGVAAANSILPGTANFTESGGQVV